MSIKRNSSFKHLLLILHVSSEAPFFPIMSSQSDRKVKEPNYFNTKRQTCVRTFFQYNASCCLFEARHSFVREISASRLPRLTHKTCRGCLLRQAVRLLLLSIERCTNLREETDRQWKGALCWQPSSILLSYSVVRSSFSFVFVDDAS